MKTKRTIYSGNSKNYFSIFMRFEFLHVVGYLIVICSNLHVFLVPYIASAN